MPINPDKFEQYGRMKPRERRKDKNAQPTNEEQAGHKEEDKGFFSRFNAKTVSLKLTTGETLEGVLSCDRYNKYDCLLENEEGLFMIPKHGIVFIREMKETEQ